MLWGGVAEGEGPGERAREKRRLAKARKKERRQRLEREREREKGERSTPDSYGDSNYHHGDVGMATKHNSAKYSSTNHRGTRKGGGVPNHSGTTAAVDVPNREPIEDDNEWEFRHTCSPPKVGGASGMSQLNELRSMFNMDQEPEWLGREGSSEGGGGGGGGEEEEMGRGGWFPAPRENPETRAQLEARELAAYRYAVWCGVRV